jgi:hypothetical protein
MRAFRPARLLQAGPADVFAVGADLAVGDDAQIGLAVLAEEDDSVELVEERDVAGVKSGRAGQAGVEHERLGADFARRRAGVCSDQHQLEV